MQVIRIFKRELIEGDIIYFSSTIVGKVSGASKYLRDSRNLKSRIQNWETCIHRRICSSCPPQMGREMGTTDRKKHG